MVADKDTCVCTGRGLIRNTCSVFVMRRNKVNDSTIHLILRSQTEYFKTCVQLLQPYRNSVLPDEINDLQLSSFVLKISDSDMSHES
jgi:hypothetical protein